MKIRMKVGISGTLDGVPYPPVGEVVDWPDVAAAKLLASGQAVKASAKDDEVETRPASTEDVETTTVKSTPAKRAAKPKG